VPSVILNAEDHVADAARRVQDTPQNIFLIRMHPAGWNIIARDTLRLLSSEGKGEFTLASVISRANAAVSLSRSST
jgi:hypothetical protein